MFRKLRAPRADRESGTAAIEYPLIAALIAVVIIVVLSVMGGNLSGVFAAVTDNLAQAAGGQDSSEVDPCSPDSAYRNWYWNKVDAYTGGYYVTGANGTSWHGAPIASAPLYAFSEHGAILQADTEWSDRGGNTYRAIIDYENGRLMMTVTGDPGVDPSLYAEVSQGQPGIVWTGEHTHTAEASKGTHRYTAWLAVTTPDSPVNVSVTNWQSAWYSTGGVQYANPPATTNVTYGLGGCGAGASLGLNDY